MTSSLISTSHTQMLPTGWKFVNRYANRSNKGIPMFAEERLKERAEKQVAGNRGIVSMGTQLTNYCKSQVYCFFVPLLPEAAVNEHD